MANISKHDRLRRPPKPEFLVTGLLIGVFGGEALAIVVEVAVRRPNHWIMLAGGVAGALLGAVFEGARYLRSRRRWRAFKNLENTPSDSRSLKQAVRQS